MLGTGGGNGAGDKLLTELTMVAGDDAAQAPRNRLRVPRPTLMPWATARGNLDLPLRLTGLLLDAACH